MELCCSSFYSMRKVIDNINVFALLDKFAICELQSLEDAKIQKTPPDCQKKPERRGEGGTGSNLVLLL